MSRRKANESQGGFGKLLFWTLILSIVFSAGLITGQRVLLHESLPPLVSVPDGLPTLSAHARQGSTDTVEEPKPTAYSFYDQLKEPAQRVRRPEETAPAPKPAPAQVKPVEEKPIEVTIVQEKPVEVAPASEAVVEPVVESVVESVVEDVAEPTSGPVVVAEGEPEPDPVVMEEVKEVDEVKEVVAEVKESLPARYTLQIAAHPTLDRARGEMDRLGKLGHEPHIISAEVPGQGTFYRVRIGKFHSMDEARTFQSDLKQRGGLDTFVTPL
ncbi:MAG: SPOR domain-containing protein, partial [Bradymonadaceae bacterium]